LVDDGHTIGRGIDVACPPLQDVGLGEDRHFANDVAVQPVENGMVGSRLEFAHVLSDRAGCDEGAALSEIFDKAPVEADMKIVPPGTHGRQKVAGVPKRIQPQIGDDLAALGHGVAAVQPLAHGDAGRPDARRRAVHAR